MKVEESSPTYKTFKVSKKRQDQITTGSTPRSWQIELADLTFTWSNAGDRIALLRQGLPYDVIEVVSNQASLPVKDFLHLLGIAQTTYNKKKREGAVLDSRHSEMILILTEVLDFGLTVFNDESEKFSRWLSKPNISLGGECPTHLFDSLTGIQEVKYCLNRIEYGSLA